MNLQTFTEQWPFIRSVLLFAGGMMGIGYEAIRHGVERPFQLGIYAGMLGINIVMAGRGKNGG